MTAVLPFTERIQAAKLLLGVVHLRPLPGSPGHRGERLAAIEAAARADAEALLEAGFDGYLVENFGDMPFYPGPVPPHVLTAMTRIALGLPREGALVGANVLRNDASGALAVALGASLHMIRVNVHTGVLATDQGLIEGKAAWTLRERSALAPGVAILADVDVKHASPVGAFDLAAAAEETAHRGRADALIVTGKGTGKPVRLDDLRTVRAAVPAVPILAGSGVTLETVRRVLRLADGVIVGTAIKRDGRVLEPVDPRRAKAFVARARE
jgi:hypothetical protein